MAREPTAAESMYGHLPHDNYYEAKQQDHKGTLAELMYPKPKPKPTNPRRDLLLKNLREHNARRR